ncbi:unnamed protein product [Durusdinium trenchii]|uniref:Uncharacterized protein n=1 Tax=Durusdinium trenchii TaxID=1381693 RepID=A0ABP0Q1R2_9DINO
MLSMWKQTYKHAGRLAQFFFGGRSLWLAMRNLRSLSMSKLQVAALLGMGAPPILIHLLDFVDQNLDKECGLHFRDLQCAEFFGGCESIVRGFRELGSSAPWMPYLNQKITKAMRLQIRQRAEVQRKQMVKTTVSKSSNKKSVSGGADMGASAAYPRDFGRHVASSHVSIINDPSTTLPDLQALVNGGFREPPLGLWDRADLRPVVAFLEHVISQGKLRRDPLVPVQIAPSREVFERVRARWRGEWHKH